jgi:hypothetical protein
MEREQHVKRTLRRGTLALAGAAALGVSGCGSDDDYANEPRPPAPIVVTAAITPDGVAVSPSEFGAGPINLIVANQTEGAQQVTFEASGDGGGDLSQTTGPISPRDTATLKADLEQGTYALRAGEGSIKAAKIEVGASRPSAQNELLQP